MLNSSNSSNVVWTMDYSDNVNSSYTTITTACNNTYQFSLIMKRCRNCKHSHASEGMGCYDVVNMMVTYAVCSCKEHVPEDNLEFLEYLSRKKESI